MENDCVKLPDVYSDFYGVGIPGLTAKLIKRTDTKAMYYRWDNVYEVFKIHIDEPRESFGKQYPKREIYPGNEDFGRTAWCYNDEKAANKMYDSIP